MRKISLKIKLTLSMAGLVAALIVVIILLNNFVLEKYYDKNRLNELKTSYEEIYDLYTDNADDDSAILSSLRRTSALHGINVFIINSDWEILYGSQDNNFEYIRWFQDMIFNADADKEVIEEKDNYIILKGNDSDAGLSYYEIYGALFNGNQIIMRITIEGLRESVGVFNQFVLIVGGILLVISIAVAYILSSGLTKPVRELSDIAEKMSEMNFEVKYTGKLNDEIGLLGKSMNIMSESLEKNISELKTANMELKRDIELKNHIEEMRTDFLSNVSHELKTPIAIIQGYAEGLKEGINDDPENTAFYCDVIMDEAGKMNNMVKKLLTLNQLEFGNEQLNIEYFDMSEVVAGVIRNNTLRLEQKGITLNYDREPVFIWFDELQLEEVVTNYISNAINHCEGDKIIRIEIKPTDDKVRFSVFNTGESIPEDSLDRIWEKFYKVDKARTREYGGNGIGLSIVRAILERYGAVYGAVNTENGVEFFAEFSSGDKY